jgi:FO synthase
MNVAISDPALLEVADLMGADLGALMARAAGLRDSYHGRIQSYSPKVFIPLTHLCRDVCHYCTFARPPRRGETGYMTLDAVLAVARAGAAAGCTEALFTLGDKPELRYGAAREELARMGHETTLSYVAEAAALVLKETGLLPHINAGVMGGEDIARLRKVSVSQGLMLESASERLSLKGGPHYGSPDKNPARRLETIRLAGELNVPFTSGLLIGIGETREERVESILALRDLNRRYGHIQEVIIQNFRAKPDTKMAHAPEPDLKELLWTIAVARILLGAQMNIQAPPNLTPGDYGVLIAAGINDWGGISPITADHVNPEAPWPHIEALRRETASAGKVLTARLPIYPAYYADNARWQDQALVPHILKSADSHGWGRDDRWAPGLTAVPQLPPSTLFASPLEGEVGPKDREGGNGAAFSAPSELRRQPPHPSALRATDLPLKGGGAGSMKVSAQTADIVAKAASGQALDEHEITTLFSTRGEDMHFVIRAADDLRKKVNGDTVTYAVNRNINYTNICGYKCRFCAFSKGKTHEALRGVPYDLDLAEVARRAVEAWDRGATEVCMQGGIHPDYTGETYLALCRAVKDAVPDMHIHAFSSLEIQQGAATLGIPVADYLLRLKAAGLGTLPGTAAEILDDEIRDTLCHDKLNTQEWLDIMEAAHEAGFRTTATIMFGHIEGPHHWARHILRIRALQERTGGFTEFVPLPFVHMEAPMYLKGGARKGPTFRETVLMHAVARLALHPVLTNIQVSWVKLGREGVRICLEAGANDMGGTLMNESISRAAGTEHGQELPPPEMEALIRSLGRVPRQRNTVYGPVSEERHRAGMNADALTPMVLTPPKPIRRKFSATA